MLWVVLLCNLLVAVVLSASGGLRLSCWAKLGRKGSGWRTSLAMELGWLQWLSGWHVVLTCFQIAFAWFGFSRFGGVASQLLLVSAIDTPGGRDGQRVTWGAGTAVVRLLSRALL